MSVVINGTGSISGLSNVGGIASAQSGSVIQTVVGTTGTQTSSTTNSFIATNLTVSITPQFSTSKILVFTTGGVFDNGSSGLQLVATIYRNNTTNLGNASRGLCEMYSNSGQIQTPVSLGTLDSPATTSATSYTLYIKNATASGTVYFQSDACVATIIAMEIAA